MNPNLTEIEIAGESYGFRFGMAFIRRMSPIVGTDGNLTKTVEKLGEVLKEDLYGNAFKMMSESHSLYLERGASIGHKMTPEEFEDLIDEDGGFQSGAVLKFVEAWTNSMNKDVPDEKPVNGAKKPKPAAKAKA